MAEVTYEYNAWSSNTGWNNPDYAVDGQNGNEASVIKVGTGSTGHLTLSSTDAPGTNLGTITKVEFGVYGSVTGPDMECTVQPDGGDIFAMYPGSPAWEDITENPGNWTWDMVKNLDVDMWGFNWGAGAETLYVDQVYLRITYDEITGPANILKVLNVSSDNISKILSINYTNINKINNIS